VEQKSKLTGCRLWKTQLE